MPVSVEGFEQPAKAAMINKMGKIFRFFMIKEFIAFILY